MDLQGFIKHLRLPAALRKVDEEHLKKCSTCRAHELPSGCPIEDFTKKKLDFDDKLDIMTKKEIRDGLIDLISDKMSMDVVIRGKSPRLDILVITAKIAEILDSPDPIFPDLPNDLLPFSLN